VNLSYESPYQFARRFASLDHLTNGRIGWNIVTGYLDSAQRLIGENGLKDHDLRYEQAEEFLQLCYKFWEGSWEDDAVLKNKQQRIYTDPAKVHQINHQASFIAVRVYSRFPLLFSVRLYCSRPGLHRVVWLSLPSMLKACLLVVTSNKIKKQVDQIRCQATEQGRDPEAIKIFVGITVVTAETDELAQQKLDEYRAYASPEAGLAHYSSSVGIDLAIC
jgi:Coenzyme F420-dependent N5,N10-methylene tetrahydromethanopterin reductase and related flavin-dependent oxidoreductases